MRGLEKIWVIGNTFCNNSFDQHYKNIEGPGTTHDKESSNYAFKNYEVRKFASNQYDSFFSGTQQVILGICLLKQ